MKNYIKKIILTSFFVLAVFFAATPKADAFIGLNIGFGSSTMSSYGYGYNPYSYYAPNYNTNWYGNGYMPFYGNNYGYYGSPYQSYYGANMGSYYNTGYYYDYMPTPNPGYYTSNRMYSNWYGY